MWTYVFNSLAWSAVGLMVGAGLTELGYDLRNLARHSGRRKQHDDT